MASQPRSSLTNIAVIWTLLLVCAGFTVGLTFAPCYSSMCVENYFPYTIRVHLALFYSLLAGVLLWMTATTFTSFSRLSDYTLTGKALPLISKRLTVGGAIFTIYLLALIFGTIGYWLPAENYFWRARAEPIDFTQKIYRLVWTGVTGHWLDILIGLVILPVGHHSIIARTFRLHASTLLLAHKILAYALCAGALVHGFLYYSFLAAWVDATGDEQIAAAFAPDNPALTFEQSEAVGGYAWLNLISGAASGIILIPIMVITALPILRRINYNTFYFLHITLSFFVIVLVCIHASTDFYCILPGLLLYVYDIIWRLRYSLAHKAEVEIEAGGDGWYSVVLPPIVAPNSNASTLEKGVQASPPPLQTYYLNIPSISKVEVHAFTAATAGTEGVRPRLLLRKSPARKLAKKSDKEWTWKLATLADSAPAKTTTTARIEGPYSPSTPELYTAERMLCLVAGTGISGALSLAKWWTQQEHSSAQAMFRLVWTVRSREQCSFPDLLEVQTLIQQHSNMELVIHISGESGRLDLDKAVEGFTLSAVSSWVYICGPEQFSAQADQACWSAKQSLDKQDRHAFTWYNSSYAV